MSSNVLGKMKMANNRILIQLPELVSFDECKWFLDRKYDDCLHIITPESIRKALLIAEEPVLIDITQKGDALLIDILSDDITDEVRGEVKAFVTGWFDLERDLKPFYSFLETDTRVAYMASKFSGLRLIGIPDVFEALCWSIIGQQINLSFAYKLKRRLVETYGSYVSFGGAKHFIFPTPETLAQADIEELRSMQFSQRKAEYVIGVARAFAEGTLSRAILNELPDMAARQKALMNLKGIGLWTANYALMKSLREPAAIPYGDVGLLNALTTHGIIAGRSETKQIEQFFGQIPEWGTYITTYFWRSLAVRAM